MSRYDPMALPPWEVERGGGPVTERHKEHRRIELRAELKQLSYDIKLLAPNASPNSTLYAKLTEMRERRNEIRKELGFSVVERVSA